MRVLLVSPGFHGYHSAIASALTARGHDVTTHVYDDHGGCKPPSPPARATGPLRCCSGSSAPTWPCCGPARARRPESRHDGAAGCTNDGEPPAHRFAGALERTTAGARAGTGRRPAPGDRPAAGRGRCRRRRSGAPVPGAGPVRWPTSALAIRCANTPGPRWAWAWAPVC